MQFAVIKKMADVDFTTMLCEPELVMITARTVLFAYINLGIINIYLTNFMVFCYVFSGIYLRYNVFCSLRIMVKSTSRHLFYYRELGRDKTQNRNTEPESGTGIRNRNPEPELGIKRGIGDKTRKNNNK